MTLLNKLRVYYNKIVYAIVLQLFCSCLKYPQKTPISTRIIFQNPYYTPIA